MKTAAEGPSGGRDATGESTESSLVDNGVCDHLTRLFTVASRFLTRS